MSEKTENKDTEIVEIQQQGDIPSQRDEKENETLASSSDSNESETDKTPEKLIQTLITDNEALRKEAELLRDQMLRLNADMENLRRRTEREMKDVRQFSISNFARDLLSVGDNLERAILAVSEEDKTEGHKGLVSLLEGVEMTNRELVRVMEKYGVTKLIPEGQKFDPNCHQAMFEVPSKDVPKGTVVQVVQAGYNIGERILRPAMVGVSTGGPKPPQPDQVDVASDS